MILYFTAHREMGSVSTVCSLRKKFHYFCDVNYSWKKGAKLLETIGIEITFYLFVAHLEKHKVLVFGQCTFNLRANENEVIKMKLWEHSYVD